MRRNSPFTGCPSISSAIFDVRPPSATATSTRATSVVGCTRSAIRALIEAMEVFHEPATSPRVARSAMRPSRPTTLSRRTISVVSPWLRATTSLNVLAISAIRPLPRVNGSRTSNSPRCAAIRASRSWRRRASSCACWPLPFPCPPSPRLRFRMDSPAGSYTPPTVSSMEQYDDSPPAEGAVGAAQLGTATIGKLPVGGMHDAGCGSPHACLQPGLRQPLLDVAVDVGGVVTRLPQQRLVRREPVDGQSLAALELSVRPCGEEHQLEDAAPRLHGRSLLREHHAA